MTSRAEYRIRRMGGDIFTSEPELRPADLHAAFDRMWPERGPYRLKRPSLEVFGPERTEAEIIEILVNNVPDGAYGRRWVVMKDGVDRRMVVRKRAVTEGNTVLQEALNQLGDDYNWASAGPDRFDCSGLTLFVYRQVDVILPHSAYMQARDPKVTLFKDRSKVKDGDLVFCDASDRPSPNHVGIADAPGQIVDASSSYDMIVHRPIDSNPIVAFGRVQAVNGRLD